MWKTYKNDVWLTCVRSWHPSSVINHRASRIIKGYHFKRYWWALMTFYINGTSKIKRVAGVHRYNLVSWFTVCPTFYHALRLWWVIHLRPWDQLVQRATSKANEHENVNSLWPSDAIWRHGSASTLVQVMACCLTAPSHYLNQSYHH